MKPSSSVDRRRYLKVAGTAALVPLAGCTLPVIKTNPASSAYPHRRFVIGAEASAWRGIEPEEVADERNPTLHLLPGKTTRIVWRNLDGKRHKLVVEDSMENVLHESDVSTERGETHTLTMEVTQEMTTYLCEFHEVSMRGDILVSTD